MNELCLFLGCRKSTLFQYNREGLPRFYVGKECRYILFKVIDWLERRSRNRAPQMDLTFDPKEEIKNASKRS